MESASIRRTLYRTLRPLGVRFMAIGIIFRFPPTASDACKTYDAIVDDMGVRNNPAQGALYHWAAPANGGLIIVDLWETQKDFDRFAQEKIYPITQKHG